MEKLEAPNLIQAMGRFDEYLSVERNLAPSTRKAYEFDLGKFRDFLKRGTKTEPRLQGIDKDTVREWLAYLQRDRDYRSSTLARSIASLRVFFRFCVENGYLQASPAEAIRNPKLPRKLPVYLVESELRQLLQSPDASDVWGCRDYAMLVTLGFTGIRRQELVGLDLNMIDLESNSMRVMGKGRKERLVPLNPIVLEALSGWLEARPIHHQASSALFISNRGTRITGRQVLNIVQKYVGRAGLVKEKISPHKLRHTFATMLHLNNVDILEIKSLLGHASITSTQIYTHTNTNRLKAAVERLSKSFTLADGD